MAKTTFNLWQDLLIDANPPNRLDRGESVRPGETEHEHERTPQESSLGRPLFWDEWTATIRAKEEAIKLHEDEALRLKKLVEEKDEAIFLREQAISIRDKWLEQLSMENQIKANIIITG